MSERESWYGLVWRAAIAGCVLIYFARAPWAAVNSTLELLLRFTVAGVPAALVVGAAFRFTRGR